MFDYKGVKFTWLGHDGFKIKDGQTIYIDPYQIKPDEEADILLITHEHFDHLSVDDVKRIISENTTVITTPACKAQLVRLKVKEVKAVKPGDKVNVAGIAIEAVPAYNVDKFRSPGKVFHPKEEQKVGFILSLAGLRIYHAGDTDFIPEMRNLQVDVALLPVSGTYVMTAEQAAEAARQIKPKLAIPMHYGAIVGSESDAQKFAKLAGCEVKILTKG